MEFFGDANGGGVGDDEERDEEENEEEDEDEEEACEVMDAMISAGTTVPGGRQRTSSMPDLFCGFILLSSFSGKISLPLSAN